MLYDSVAIDKVLNLLEHIEPVRGIGRVEQIIGLVIESSGPPDVNMGETCCIMQRDADPLMAEVVGFRNGKVLLMVLGEMRGIGPGCEVYATGGSLRVAVGDSLLGSVLDGLGRPIDGTCLSSACENISIYANPSNPLDRPRIKKPLPVGVKAIDGLLTFGRGQRVGIFAGSGVGKSTLLGMIAKNTVAEVNVIALIGERGREVKEFIERDLGPEGLKRSVVVVATSDQPALVRIKGAFVATAIAEYFRDEGKDVLLMMDSLTRFSMAQREVGLSTGEPPTTKGYTPSVFALMPKLLERCGTNNVGSITGIYTVLVDGDDMDEPIADAARGILDGHVVLSRKLANRNHFPSIDVLASISRVMPQVITKEHAGLVDRVKNTMAVYRDAEDLINIGAYVNGSSPQIDEAINLMPQINAFLRQSVIDKYEFADVINELAERIGVSLVEVPAEREENTFEMSD